MSIAEVSNPVTSTKSGPVMGREKNGVFHFCGIPYAAPATGTNRFKRAMPAESWTDILDATRFGPAAPQLPSGGLTDNTHVRWDEDCLFVNVCTPAIDDGKRPVMVWIHGGAYRTGQGAIPWYNGTSFALNGDIVVVSINYRLGALGFADMSRFGDDYANSGVNGLLDQIMALTWVRDNISSFGGDPKKVTIAGESAGGFAVGTLLGSPAAAGLFHRAIPQSGAAHHTHKPATGELIANMLLEELEAESIQAMQARSPLEILEAQQRVEARCQREGIGRGVGVFYPVEGNEVIPDTLIGAVTAGVGATVPILTGTNKDESTLFVAGKVSADALTRQANDYGGGQRLIDAYRNRYPGASDRDISAAMATDFTFKIPAIRLTEMREKHDAETWLYQFDWESRVAGLKATHALEIPFTFNTLDSAGVDAFIGPGEKPQPLADEMHNVWTRFIRGESPGWARYQSDTRATMHFADTSHLVENEESNWLPAWQGLR